MNLENLPKILENQPKYRFKQTYMAIFQGLISDWSEATTLPLDLRNKLSADCSLFIDGEVLMSQKNGAKKALIILEDGLKIETVLMEHDTGRNTVCVSSQVGCKMGCQFCATGQMGFTRDLTRDEIVIQILFFARLLKTQNKRVTNVVFMGMGEPFLNYANVLKAVRFINDENTFNIGARKISISTCGVVEGIEKLSTEGLQVNLAVSLNAPNDKIRQELMPIAKRYPLKNIFMAVDRYIKKTSRKVMFEYAMIKGVNDSAESAKELAVIMKKYLYMVNLISYNPTGKFEPSDRKSVEMFKTILGRAGVSATERFRFGRDIEAACGQLATDNEDE